MLRAELGRNHGSIGGSRSRSQGGLVLALVLAGCGGESAAEGDTDRASSPPPLAGIRLPASAENLGVPAGSPQAEAEDRATAGPGELQFYASAEAPVSEQVRESMMIGAVLYRAAFYDTLARLEARRVTLEKKGDDNGLLSVGLVLREVRRLREVALGQRVIIVPENGAALLISRPLIALLDGGLRGRGLLLPKGGWYSDPRRSIAFEPVAESRPDPSELGLTRIRRGRWAGAFRDTDGGVLIPGLRLLGADLSSPRASPPPDPPPATRLHPADGASMVEVPAGPFAFGLFGQPLLGRLLPVYWIDVHEVSNRRYARFVEATGHRVPPYWKDGRPPAGQLDHPVVEVSYGDAEAYCRWAGKRLPSAEEWEKAARGTSDARLYPWGNNAPSGKVLERLCRIRAGTSPVDSHPAGTSPFGLFHTVGNVAEWTSSGLDPRLEVLGRELGRMTRGGGWDSGRLVPISPPDVRTRHVDTLDDALGFRTVDAAGGD